MTPPKPNGSIAVGVIVECSIQQPVNSSEICELVGGVMTPPYEASYWSAPVKDQVVEPVIFSIW